MIKYCTKNLYLAKLNAIDYSNSSLDDDEIELVMCDDCPYYTIVIKSDDESVVYDAFSKTKYYLAFLTDDEDLYNENQFFTVAELTPVTALMEYPSDYVDSYELVKILNRYDKSRKNISSCDDIVLAMVSILGHKVDSFVWLEDARIKLKDTLYTIAYEYVLNLKNTEFNNKGPSLETIKEIKNKYINKLIEFDEKLTREYPRKNEYEYELDRLKLTLKEN